MLGDVRDVVLIVTGIVWTIIFLVILAVTLVISYLTHKYLGIAHEFLTERVPPALSEVQSYADAVRLQTAALPGSGSTLPPGQGMPHFDVRLPFFRRRRTWWQRLLPH
ncbi:MAG TPA: hypothetical protein VK821_19555 [Dehalococcoidia bacterium]|nr:hypothetical protein [Dehalococcoidia bacterium]